MSSREEIMNYYFNNDSFNAISYEGMRVIEDNVSRVMYLIDDLDSYIMQCVESLWEMVRKGYDGTLLNNIISLRCYTLFTNYFKDIEVDKVDISECDDEIDYIHGYNLMFDIEYLGVIEDLIKSSGLTDNQKLVMKRLYVDEDVTTADLAKELNRSYVTIEQTKNASFNKMYQRLVGKR